MWVCEVCSHVGCSESEVAKADMLIERQTKRGTEVHIYNGCRYFVLQMDSVKHKQEMDKMRASILDETETQIDLEKKKE